MTWAISAPWEPPNAGMAMGSGLTSPRLMSTSIWARAGGDRGGRHEGGHERERQGLHAHGAGLLGHEQASLVLKFKSKRWP